MIGHPKDAFHDHPGTATPGTVGEAADVRPVLILHAEACFQADAPGDEIVIRNSACTLDQTVVVCRTHSVTARLNYDYDCLTRARPPGTRLGVENQDRSDIGGLTHGAWCSCPG